MSIDIHNHAIPQGVLELVGSRPVYGVTVSGGWWTSKNIGTFPLIDAWHDPDAKLREMDGKELERAVLSVAPKPLYYYELDLPDQAEMARVANTGLAAFCTGHEDRLRWMAHLPLAYPAEAAKVMREALEQGASGVELGTSANGKRFDDPVFDVLWSELESLGVPVFLHPAYESEGPENDGFAIPAVLGLPYETTNALYRMIYGGVLDRHPRLRVAAALGGGIFPYVAGRMRHYGTYRPEMQDAPKDPWTYVGQIKFDTHLHDPLALRFLIDKAGQENVMIGTDCSFQSCTPAPMEELRAALSDRPDAFDAVSDANAAAMFWGQR
jgi:aminocarboxymuconate-semialdehyde decarboxylase